MSTKEAIRTAKVRRLAEFRAFPKHTAGWSLDRFATDGHCKPGQSRGGMHAKDWPADNDNFDFHRIAPWSGKAKHRRTPKHRGVLDKYAHLGYRVQVAA